MFNRGNRDRKNAVPAANCPRPVVQDRNNHVFDAEAVETDGGCNDVDNRICGADLVKMNFIHRNPVSFGFRLCEDPEGIQGDCTGILTHVSRSDDLFDFLEPPVNMRVSMSVIMRMFCLRVLRFRMIGSMISSMQIIHIMIVAVGVVLENYVKIAGFDSVFHNSAYTDFKTVKGQRVQGVF